MAVPQSVSAVFSAYASFATTMMLIRSLTNQLLPPKFISFLSSIFVYFFGSVSSDPKFVIHESSGVTSNEVLQTVEIYLYQHKGNTQKRHFQLSFPRKFKDRVVDFYLPYVLTRAKEFEEDNKSVKIFSQECYDDYTSYGDWGSVNLDHPATFDTLAMDHELKQWIINDLDRFVRRKNLYKKVGQAWKMGYLLYGPPGTGKSSLIAAIANYLKFDIFDLDLSNIHTNSNLRRLLLATKNRSILVIEDIDCSVEIQNRESGEHFDRSNSKFTLSGMLNFIDGLWSSIGDERIVIFTTNHKERLDPALPRLGRMDVHINMSYCSSQGFKVLASNYLGGEVSEHRVYREIEELIGDTEVSPAEIAEELMKGEDVETVLGGLVGFLKRKREEQRKERGEE
ncbi:unnamed protein product [Citrullus colocynthis]|uniref:AAA+ ATPase domain-containing protein n=1 Tax=Citrullus colocynthis TaxID=252529 RepID=A0ABP0YMD5_9ROSI